MGLNDHALVVGINQYPELTNLEGPEADAIAFADWLRTDARVQVPAGQVRLLLSSDYPKPGGVNLARPIAVDVEAALKSHIDRGDNNGGHAGERLYLYFAGHGMAPDVDEVALLMANAGRRNPGDHIGGRRYTKWFRQAAMFDQIVLIMDCCREPSLNAPPKAPPWPTRTVMKPVQFFYAFATSWPSAAREVADKGGAVRGVFTEVLLEGLSGRKIASNTNGEITTGMVEGWVLDRFEELADPDQPVERQQPKFESDPRDTFVLLRDVAAAPAAPGAGAPVAAARATIRIKRKDNGPGNQIEVFDHAGTKLTGGAQNGTFEISLPAGWYKATAPGGLSDLFEVTDAGGTIDVSL